MRRVIAVVGAAATLVAALLIGAPPATADQVFTAAVSKPKPARARAWVVRISVSSDTQQVLQVGEVSAEGGASPWATAVPGAVGGQSPWRASASPKTPNSVVTPMTWTDSTGSGTVEGAFAEAHVLGDTAKARAGLGAQSGTGFPLASQLLTWDQQVALMDQWTAMNDQVFIPLNDAMASLAPALAPAGLKPPHFEPMAGLGWIDVASVQQAAADVLTSASAGSATAKATAGNVQLLGGFIEASNVVAEAVSQGAGDVTNRAASATIGSLKIAGVPVVADGDGFRAAGNDLVSRTVIQPTLQQILAQMKDGGITLWPAATEAIGDMRGAAALQVEIASPQGSVLISIAHAQASATSVGGFEFEVPPVAPLVDIPPAPPAFEPVVDVPISTDPVGQVTLPSTEPTQAASGPTGPRTRVFPASVVRSLRTTYLLLFLVGGLVAAVVVPMLARPVVARPVIRKGGLL